MFYADQVGLPRILAVMRDLHAKQGDVLKPAALLERLAGEGKGFKDLQAKS